MNLDIRYWYSKKIMFSFNSCAGQAMKARKTGVIVVGHLAFFNRKEAPKFFFVKVNGRIQRGVFFLVGP